MPLNVKNDEAHDLARELSELTDTTITEAVTLALRETLARVRRRRRVEQTRRVQDLLQIATECGELPVLDDRLPDQILDYDEHGSIPMIAVDTSALFAILANETERAIFVDAIAGADRCFISAATQVEIGMVISSRFGPAGQHYLSTFLSRAGIETQPVDAEQVETAITAYRRFGKGIHPGGLNFGDCFSYALARTLDVPLLFKGDEFSETDIERAV